MIKNIYTLKKIGIVGLLLIFSQNTLAQKVTLRAADRTKKRVQVVEKKQKVTPKKVEKKQIRSVDVFDIELQKVSSLLEQGQFQNAAIKLFILLRSPQIKNRTAQVRYMLGVALTHLNLKQIASFQFIQAMDGQQGPIKKSSVQKLSEIAADLGDETLLNYVFNNLQLKDFPETEKEALYFKLGQVRYENGDYSKALELFKRVGSSSRFSLDAQYYMGLSYSQMNEDEKALNVYQNLLTNNESKTITSPVRVQSQLAVARSYYKKQNWETAISEYAKIPRDSEYWTDALFEQTWAMLRSGRLRSALSNFHTLHSPYYENIYNPESLLLRSIVYLYICKYDEMDKVLSIYKKNYNSLSKELKKSIGRAGEIYEQVDSYRRGKKDFKFLLPIGVIRKILLQEEIQNQFFYLDKITSEKKLLVENYGIKKTSLGIYGLKVLNRRIVATENKIALMIKESLIKINTELQQFSEQADLIAFEMTSGKTQQLKKKISNNSINTMDEKISRDFFIENGFQYYAFKGEYWWDEVGNFHYFGQQGCE
ncbi:MAG TPA: tetratricopeptide repeat protein [Pseudobdellovibrionaceae bacterium]|nr:tetratricopeptide repeat protein [Pseudobdellovibrionaceae bacterium]